MSCAGLPHYRSVTIISAYRLVRRPAMSTFDRAKRTRLTGVLAAALLIVTALTATSPAQAAAARPAPTPLPANLETIRAAEATALYGDPAIRPIETRKTALIT